MLDPLAAAKRIGVSTDTLKRWRRRKPAPYGPPFLRTESGTIRYPEPELEQWIEDRTVSA